MGRGNSFKGTHPFAAAFQLFPLYLAFGHGAGWDHTHLDYVYRKLAGWFDRGHQLFAGGDCRIGNQTQYQTPASL